MRILSITAALLIAVGISSLSAQDKKAKKAQ